MELEDKVWLYQPQPGVRYLSKTWGKEWAGGRAGLLQKDYSVLSPFGLPLVHILMCFFGLSRT